ncbi:MAG TPA: pilus assembly protein PilM [Candidatus Paceibacterota bacterium]|nr:pilus assembly protein PilM [Candidatus Paceibacterota bacterium]HRZ34202.1 pilus assembly protein PilM [Candidatus Paceibacterota bacterium]
MSRAVRFFSRIKESFPVPRFLSLNPVAIDISTQKIRLMRLRRSGDQLLPQIFREVTVAGQYDSSSISRDCDASSKDAQVLIETLTKLRKELDLKYVGAILPDIESYVYKIQLPAAARADVLSAVKFSLEENVPLSFEESVFDYSVIDDESLLKKGKIDVIVNVFPKKVIAAYTEILERAGLTPVCFESESAALAEAVVGDGDIEPYLLIRLAADRTNVAIVERNVVQYSSSIQVSVRDAVADPAGEKATELKNALNKLLIFWFTNRDFGEEHKKINTAIVAGEESLSQEIDEFLERHLKIGVRAGNAWTNCLDLEKQIPTIDRAASLNYAAVIGLALKLKLHG